MLLNLGIHKILRWRNMLNAYPQFAPKRVVYEGITAMEIFFFPTLSNGLFCTFLDTTGIIFCLCVCFWICPISTVNPSISFSFYHYLFAYLFLSPFVLNKPLKEWEGLSKTLCEMQRILRIKYPQSLREAAGDSRRTDRTNVKEVSER